MPLPTDPLLASQWYLRNTTAGQLDLNLASVWNPTEGPAYTGAGITNVVIGDGFDYTHPDIAMNYEVTLGFDYVGANDFDPFGDPTDLRGTALLGILGGAANNGGMVGVAFGSTLIGYRVEAPGSNTWLTSLAQAITASANSAGADVTLMGQSFMGQPASMFGAGYTQSNLDAVDGAIGTAVASGRGGLGTILVRGAGDGRTVFSSSNYDVNADHWGNDTRQIIVAAVTETGAVTSYSSAGAPILVSAFGSEGTIVTSDRVGLPGAPGDFTSTFQGTDAAAAMVAGVVNLMLEANPNLTMRDVQTILANSARHTGSDIGTAHSGFEQTDWGFNAASTWNGGGLHFSNDYGFGLVDARAAVRMAESWFDTNPTTVGRTTNFNTLVSAATIIPDGNPTGTAFTTTIAGTAPIDQVSLNMTFSTTFLADLEVYVTSPDGSTSRLIADIGGSTDFDGTYTFETQAFRGERRDGQWSVRVVDDSGGDTLSVSNLQLVVAGANTTDDRYVFTNEYSDYDGVAGHLTAITDSNGGTDTVDASAVTSNSLIRLTGVPGSIDFVSVSFANIEHAIAGDGNDTLIGNDGANILVGNRGIDSLSGGGGNDSLYGGTGNDLLEGGAGDNLLVGGADNDTYIITSIGDVIVEDLGGGRDVVRTALSSFSIAGVANVEDLVATGVGNVALTGNALNNELFGNAGNNVLTGNAGNDTLLAGAGNDTLAGGAGNDVLQGTSGINLLFGEDGNDQIFAGTGGDFIGGGAGNDLIRGGVGADTIYGGLGNDDLAGGAGNDLIFGSAGNNIIYAGPGNDTVQGGDGSDTILGGAGNNQLFGNDGNDLIYTSAAGDFVGGGAGNDTIFGSDGADVIFAGLGDDFIGGGAGNDQIFAGAGSNRIFGGLGNDILTAGVGTDVFTGGPGADVFIFASAASIGIGLGRDVITDFTPGIDDIDLRGLGTNFNGAAGLSGNGVKSFFYFAAGGLLIGDQNGDGVADWVLELTGAPAVTAGDLLI